MPRTTLRAINAALQAKGHKVQLVRGKDYFYFAGEDVARMRDTIVLVTRLSVFTTEQWVDEFEKLSRGTRRYNENTRAQE